MKSLATGTVRFVGAGPGNPSLLTVRADSLIRAASVILHDDLVAPEILRLAPSQAVVLNVGKRCGAKRITQAEIHALMIGFARRGFDLIRLKSGDPSIFGRLGEEIAALSLAGVSFEIVPGVSAGMAAAASLGISLTDRRLSSRVVFATAHRSSGPALPETAAGLRLAREDSTLVIYMPGRNLTALQHQLLDAGLAPETPAVIVSRAATPSQREQRATVATLASVPALEAPSILLIGCAVAPRPPHPSDAFAPTLKATDSGWGDFVELLDFSPNCLGEGAVEILERTQQR
jgi:uroporphyrin-III C-methyltransferase